MSVISSDLAKTFGKILLFGEYTILLNGNALAIPLQNTSFSGILKSGNQAAQNPVWKEWLKYLTDLMGSKLKELDFNWNRFEEDVDAGIHFESSIPVGYGLGSSGALTAAVFKHYISTTQWTRLQSDLNSLQNYLAIFESYFHGSSSGLDPLVSILNAPVQIVNSEVQLLQKQGPGIGNGWNLVDSGLPRQTSKLVETFKKKIDSELTFKNKMLELKTVNDLIINDFLELKPEALKAEIHKISIIQFTQLEWLIPENIKSSWQSGLESGEFYFKLCGAGGGGFFLLYDPEKKATLSISEKLRVVNLNSNELPQEVG